MDVPSTYEVDHHNCNTLSKDDRNTILIVRGSVAILSVLCCTVALVAFTIKRLYRKVIYRLAMYQVTAALFESSLLALVFMLIDYDAEKLYYRVSCKASAFMAQFWILVKLFFISWLTLHLFAFIVFFKDLKRLEWLYISSSVLIPLLVACIPFITDSYGVVGAWCYITSLKHVDNCTTRPDVVGITEQFTLYYGPAALLFTVNMIAIVVMTVTMACRTCTLKQVDRETQTLYSEDSNQHVKALKQILPLVAYPIIHFLLFLAAFVNRIYTAKEGTAAFGFTLAQTAAQSLRGFFIGLFLIVHVAVSVKSDSLRNFKSKSDHNDATYGGVTTHTSGAITTFPLAYETDVDYA